MDRCLGDKPRWTDVWVTYLGGQMSGKQTYLDRCLGNKPSWMDDKPMWTDVSVTNLSEQMSGNDVSGPLFLPFFFSSTFIFSTALSQPFLIERLLRPTNLFGES